MVKNILISDLYSTVNKELGNKKNINELLNHINVYYDKNSEELNSIGISKKILFLESDKDAIYNACGLSKIQIKSSLKKSTYIQNSWKILNEPLNIASALMLRYFTINKKDDLLKTFILYYSLYFYASLHHKYLKFDANENIMEYTINNLSNKFRLKQTGSLVLTLSEIVMVSHETYKDKLIRGEDGDIAIYVSSIKVRLNDFMKKITNEYIKNHRANNIMHIESDDYSEDNFHMADNTSYMVKRLTDSSSIRLMTYGPDMELAKLAANLAQVSENEIRNVIVHLSDEETNSINRLTELILQLYLVNGTNKIEDVRGKKFIIEAMEIYKKSNTNDKLIIEIKQILDKWLNKYSKTYKKTNREATLSNFRRAIYIYFVLHIQMCSK